MNFILILLLAAVPALAGKYDPNQDRAALRGAANASYDAASRAAAFPLAPEKAAEIRAALDETVVQANLASNAAKNLETAAANRAAEMAGELRDRASAAKDLSRAAAAQRTRAQSVSRDHDDLQGRVAAMPDASPNKAGLYAALGRSAELLSSADAALTRAESDAAAEAAAAAEMDAAEKRARHSAAELTPADVEVSRLADTLPPPVSEAKESTALLGQEPQGPNRTRAGQKISVPRDLAGQLYSAADRACNRADDYRSRSSAFDRALAAFASAKTDGGAPADARSFVDQADAIHSGVRSRLP